MKRYSWWVVAFLGLAAAIYVLILVKIRSVSGLKTDCLEKYYIDSSAITEQYLLKAGQGQDALAPAAHINISTIELDDNYRNIDILARKYLLQDKDGVLYINKNYFSKVLVVNAVSESKEVMIGKFNIKELKTTDLEEVFRFLIQSGIVRTISGESSEVCSSDLTDNPDTITKKYSVSGRTFFLRINKRNGEIWFMIKL